MHKQHDGLVNPYEKLKEIFEDCRDHNLIIDEEKLMENLLIFTVSLEHRCWTIGFDKGLSIAHKMWLAGIASGTIQVNIRKCLHDPSDNHNSIFINKKTQS